MRSRKGYEGTTTVAAVLPGVFWRNKCRHAPGTFGCTAVRMRQDRAGQGSGGLRIKRQLQRTTAWRLQDRRQQVGQGGRRGREKSKEGTRRRKRTDGF